jgi:hypothetical protein
MNRRAFLHADANATVGSTASASIAIPAAGNYTVLLRCLLRGVHFLYHFYPFGGMFVMHFVSRSRYEAGYRFSSPFTVAITQAGKQLCV